MGGIHFTKHTLNFWMFDPRYKKLVCLKEFVGHEQVVQLVAQYDQQRLVPMLVWVNNFLNPTIPSYVLAPSLPILTPCLMHLLALERLYKDY